MEIHPTFLESGKKSAFIFAGVFDEASVELKPLSDYSESELHIVCREIQAITSLGIMIWMNFFNNKRKKGINLFFHECSPIIVNTASMLSTGFINKNEIKSIVLPYSCEHCDKYTDLIFTVEVLQKNKFQPPTARCSHCKNDANLIFDEVPDLYFSVFLESE